MRDVLPVPATGPRHTPWWTTGAILAVISAGLILLWVFNILPLMAPDEPAHLQAVAQVRDQHILPEVHFDFDVPGGQVAGPTGDASIRQYAQGLGYRDPYVLLPYESSQPPLYYLIVGSLAFILPRDPAILLYLARLVSAAFGAGTVFFCWAAARQFAPRAPMWAIAAAASVALLPQFCFNSATAANDSIANFLGATTFYVWIRGLRNPAYDRWMLRGGALTSLTILAKLTGVALLPGLALVILFRAGQVSGRGMDQHRVSAALRMMLGAGLMGLLICGPWVVRNLMVYGEPSGTQAALRFYQGKFALLDPANTESQEIFLQWTWESLVGRFSWMTTLMPRTFYTQAAYLMGGLLLLSGLAGLAFVGRALARRRSLDPVMWKGALVMLSVAVALAISFVEFGIQVAFVPQGRYLFLLLLPGALLLTGGLYALIPGRARKAIVLSIPLVWLAGQNTVALALVRSGWADGDTLPTSVVSTEPPATREQMIAAVVSAFSVHPYVPRAGEHTFADVSSIHPKFGAIEAGAHAGLVAGYSCGGPQEPCDARRRPYFRPNEPVRRQHLAKILALANRWRLITPVQPSFADVPSASPFFSYVETATAHDILPGLPCGSQAEPCDAAHRPYFQPNIVVTADQMNAVITRLRAP